MSVTITRVENGWMVTVPAIGEAPSEVWVYGGDDTDQADDFADALRTVVDIIGPTTSRYDAKRVSVVVEPGDKYEAKP